MTDHDERWGAVGEAIRARMDELRLTKAKLLRLSKISDKTLNGYLDGEPIRRADKGWALCEALEWTPESIDRLLNGQAPVLLERARRVDDLDEAVVEADRLIKAAEAKVAAAPETEQLEGRRLLARMRAERDLLLSMRDDAEENAFGGGDLDARGVALARKMAEHLPPGAGEAAQLRQLLRSQTSIDDRVDDLEYQLGVLRELVQALAAGSSAADPLAELRAARDQLIVEGPRGSPVRGPRTPPSAS